MQEFLSKGYLGASMRTISENAGTTPRSIYTRYGDKEGLFAALVKPAADQLKETFAALQEQYHQRPGEEQKLLFKDQDFRQEYDGYLTVMLDQIYKNRDAFKLLVCHSEGTDFAGFVDEMVAMDEKYTLLYIEHTQNDVLTSGRAKPQLIHLLCSSFMHGFYEFVRHDMPREEAIEYVNQLQQFYERGWRDLLMPES